MERYKIDIRVLDKTFTLLNQYKESVFIRRLESFRPKEKDYLLIPSDVFEELVEFISSKGSADFIINFISDSIINIEGLTQAHINKLLNACSVVLHRGSIKENPLYRQTALARIGIFASNFPSHIPDEFISNIVSSVIENGENIEKVCTPIRGLLLGTFNNKCMDCSSNLDFLEYDPTKGMEIILQLVSEEAKLKLAQETISSKDPLHFLHSYIVRLGKHIVSTNDIVSILTFVETVPFISAGILDEILNEIKKMGNPAYICMIAIKACKYSHPIHFIKFTQAVIETNDIKYITYFYLNLVHLNIALPQEVRNIITEKLNAIDLDSYRFLDECLQSKERCYLSFADDVANILKTKIPKMHATPSEYEMARAKIGGMSNVDTDIFHLILYLLKEYRWIYIQIYGRRDLYDKCETMIKRLEELRTKISKVIRLYEKIPYYSPENCMEVSKIDEIKNQISILEAMIERDSVIPSDMLDMFDKLVDYLAFRNHHLSHSIHELISCTKGLTQIHINTLLNALIGDLRLSKFNYELIRLAYTTRNIETEIEEDAISKTVTHITETSEDILDICIFIRQLLVGALGGEKRFERRDIDKFVYEKKITKEIFGNENQLIFTIEATNKKRPLYFTHKCIVELVKYVAQRKNIVDILTLIDEVPFIPSAAWDEIFKAVKEMNMPAYTYMLVMKAYKCSHPSLLIIFTQAIIETNDAKYISYFYLNLINLNIEIPKEVTDIILGKLNSMGLEPWFYLCECNKQDYLYMAEELETALKNNDLERLEEFGVSQVSNQKVYTYNSKVEVHSGDD